MTKIDSRKKKGNMLKATLSGIPGVLIPLSELQMKTHHGTTIKGVPVNSPSIGRLGDDQIAFQEGDGKIHSINANDFEIGALGYLQDIGYTVVAPKTAG